ncbi:hypothetical protein JL720_16293 [Aureococcus anophagefferens]|nr:hypothetical protein JL720_16293 [Aureococcus anophagefferens]
MRLATTRRRQTVLATAGPGFLGCLGHGDWATREALEAVADDAGNTVPLGGAGCCGVGAFGEVVSKPADVVWHDIETPPKVVDVALGFRHGLAPAATGGATLGARDDNGQLGIGGRDASPALRRVDVPDRRTRLDARVDDAAFGWKHAVAAARFNDDWPQAPAS